MSTHVKAKYKRISIKHKFIINILKYKINQFIVYLKTVLY